MLASGEQHDFFPPGELNDNLNTLTATYESIRLVGSMKDATGKAYEVSESFADLPEWRTVLHEAVELWEPEAGQRMARELGKGSSGRSRRWQPASRESATAVRDLGARRGESPNPDD